MKNIESQNHRTGQRAQRNAHDAIIDRKGEIRHALTHRMILDRHRVCNEGSLFALAARFRRVTDR